nr:hypothetical protein BSM_35240 [uncultured archaeon]
MANVLMRLEVSGLEKKVASAAGSNTERNRQECHCDINLHVEAIKQSQIGRKRKTTTSFRSKQNFGGPKAIVR